MGLAISITVVRATVVIKEQTAVKGFVLLGIKIAYIISRCNMLRINMNSKLVIDWNYQ